MHTWYSRLSLALFSALSLLAQDITLTGNVTDPQGAMIPDASVSVSQAGAERLTRSGSDGRYRMENLRPGEAILEVSASGFQRFRRTVQLETGAAERIEDVRLEVSALSDSVLVTAGRGAPVSLEEAGISATIVTEGDLKAKNFNRVSDVLRDVPGLNVVQTGSNGGTTSLFGRGGESNAMMVLIDGVPVTDPGGSINLVGLSTPGLERMEVVRGPQSALFGAEAANGVIQMFTKRGDPESQKVHGEIAYERGSFSTDHWTAGLNGGLLNRIDYSLTTDQYRSTGQYPNNAFRNTTGTANIGFRLSDRDSVRAIYREYDSFTGTPGATAFQAYNLDAGQFDRDSVVGVRFDDARNSWFTQRANFGYHRLRSNFADYLPESYALSALVRDEPGGQVYFVRMVPPGSSPDPGTRLVNSTISTFPSTSLSITDRTSAGYQATMNHTGGTFVAGYDFERQSGLITGNNVDRRNHGLSFYDQYAWRQRIFFSAGARYEHSSIFGNRFAPRGAVTFRLPTDTYLRLSLARGIKQPSLLESFAKASSYYGNPSLRPAKTDSFEAGLNRDWFNRRLHTEVAYFRNRYTDLIQFVSGPPPDYIGTWLNVSKSWSRGVELMGSAKINSYLTAQASYTRLYTKITSSATTSDLGQQLLRRPLNSGSASLQIAPRRWSVVVGARFVGNSRNSFASFGVNRITAYNYAYMSASWQASEHIVPFLRMNNLFDEQYQEVNGYGAWSRTTHGGIRVIW